MYPPWRRNYRNAVVCFEEPNERFNHLSESRLRDCESPFEWASVFNYLYPRVLADVSEHPRADDRVMAGIVWSNGQIPI